MNRLQVPKASTSASSFASSLESSDLLSETLQLAEQRGASARRSNTRYLLFAPLHYEERYAYPLLVWLHGDGGSERDLRQVMPHVSVRNYVAVAPRGVAASGSGAGYAWQQSPHEVAEAAERVQECIQAARDRYNLHDKRVFVAGYDSGGTMALRLALQHPEWFAGGVSFGGPLPSGHSPLGRIKTARRLPLLLASCRDSDRYPQASVAGDLRLLHSAGFSLSLRQYPGGDDLTTLMLADMDRWLMERVCPAASQASC